MIVIGAGILGLSVAEAASRAGRRVDVLEASHAPPASWAAAAQLGMKGQSLAKSGVFALKLGGQRFYELWLEHWAGPGPWTWFRRGWGRDRVLNDAEFLEQMRRIGKHEGDVGSLFMGPPLTFGSRERREILYAHEAAVDAPVLLRRLREVLVERGVHFWQVDACDAEALRGVLTHRRQAAPDPRDPELGLRSLVLAAGAWSFEILREWGGTWSRAADPQTVRYSLGGTLNVVPGRVVPRGPLGFTLDLDRFVIEGVIDRSQREIAALTLHGTDLRLTSLNFASHAGPLTDRAMLETLFRAPQETELRRMKTLLDRHGLALEIDPSGLRDGDIRCGLRMRATAGDIVLEKLDPPPGIAKLCYDVGFSRVQNLPRVILFTGANRSGYVYGPVLASRIVELDTH